MMQTAMMVQIAPTSSQKQRNDHETQNKRCFGYVVYMDVFGLGQNVGHQKCCMKKLN